MEMKKVEEELKKGWEATSQLLLRGKQGGGEEATESDNEKLLSIINSFDTCISILKCRMEASDSPQISSLRRETPNHAPADSHALGKQRQLNSNHASVKTVETHTLESDGYLWRKYGRKPILNTKYPREYYRCAHRDDQHCRAIKQVQMISINPIKYKIMYYSDHTCQPDFHCNNVSQIQKVLDMLEKDCPENLISFENKNPKQVLNNNKNTNKPVELHHFHGSSSSSYVHKGSGMSSSSLSVVPVTHDCDEGPSNLKLKKITEPSLLAFDDDIHDSFKQTDVVDSPSTLMSPNYYMDSYSNGVQAEDNSTLTASDEQYFHLGSALQPEDIPLWEDGPVAYTYPYLFSS